MKRNLIVLSCLLVFLAFTGSQAMAVDVYGEGAYSDTDNDVQVCIYADIGGPEALRSFGVRLIYDESELTFDGSRSSKNEADWYLKDEEGVLHDYPYGDPENVGGAVVIIGGVLASNTAYKVSGNRVLLGTVWFTRTGSGPLASPLTLGLGKASPYANFVVGPDPADVLDVSGVHFINYGDGAAVVKVRERGDADADGSFTSTDMFEVKSLIANNVYKCFADCDADGAMTSTDMFCIKNKI